MEYWYNRYWVNLNRYWTRICWHTRINNYGIVTRWGNSHCSKLPTFMEVHDWWDEMVATEISLARRSIITGRFYFMDWLPKQMWVLFGRQSLMGPGWLSTTGSLLPRGGILRKKWIRWSFRPFEQCSNRYCGMRWTRWSFRTMLTRLSTCLFFLCHITLFLFGENRL